MRLQQFSCQVVLPCADMQSGQRRGRAPLQSESTLLPREAHRLFDTSDGLLQVDLSGGMERFRVQSQSLRVQYSRARLGVDVERLRKQFKRPPGTAHFQMSQCRGRVHVALKAGMAELALLAKPFFNEFESKISLARLNPACAADNHAQPDPLAKIVAFGNPQKRFRSIPRQLVVAYAPSRLCRPHPCEGFTERVLDLLADGNSAIGKRQSFVSVPGQPRCIRADATGADAWIVTAVDVPMVPVPLDVVHPDADLGVASGDPGVADQIEVGPA